MISVLFDDFLIKSLAFSASGRLKFRLLKTLDVNVDGRAHDAQKERILLGPVGSFGVRSAESVNEDKIFNMTDLIIIVYICLTF